MELLTYKCYIEVIMRHLKKRFNNLDALQLHKLATDIVDEFVEIEKNTPK